MTRIAGAEMVIRLKADKRCWSDIKKEAPAADNHISDLLLATLAIAAMGKAARHKSQMTRRPIQSAHRCANLGGATVMSGMLWIILIGFVAGILARFLSPGPNSPTGFILTTVLGIAGAFLATFIGQSVGWYRHDQGAGFIAATAGALIVLFIWNRLVARGALRDPGNP